VNETAFDIEIEADASASRLVPVGLKHTGASCTRLIR
jgi:hypothetical protein